MFLCETRGWQGPILLESGYTLRWLKGTLGLQICLDWKDWYVSWYFVCVPRVDTPGTYRLAPDGQVVRVHVTDVLSDDERNDPELVGIKDALRQFVHRATKRNRSGLYTEETFRYICQFESRYLSLVMYKYEEATVARARERMNC